MSSSTPSNLTHFPTIDSPSTDSPPTICQVIGVATTYLRIAMAESDACIPFTQCASSIQNVQPGDRVLVRIVQGQHFVELRLMREGEAPIRITSDTEGNITLEASQALRLRTPKAEVHINADGDITLKANNIDSEAEQENRLSGRYIRLG